MNLLNLLVVSRDMGTYYVINGLFREHINCSAFSTSISNVGGDSGLRQGLGTCWNQDVNPNSTMTKKHADFVLGAATTCLVSQSWT